MRKCGRPMSSGGKPPAGTGHATPVKNAGHAMRKTIFMMLLAVVSSSAAAEWVEVSKSETVTVYPTDWTPVPPGSTNDVLLKFACAQR